MLLLAQVCKGLLCYASRVSTMLFPGPVPATLPEYLSCIPKGYLVITQLESLPSHTGGEKISIVNIIIHTNRMDNEYKT